LPHVLGVIELWIYDSLKIPPNFPEGKQVKFSPLKALSLLILLALQPVAQADVLKEHQGTWLGDMKIPNGPTIKIGTELFTRADGSSWASIAVPDQATYDIPVNSIHETGATVGLDFERASLKLTWSTDHFNGEFQEVGGPALTFPLTQVTGFPKKVRPQTPKAPFPYRDETLAIASTDGVTLGATLSMPDGVAHPNVVVLVHGAGPTTRDEDGTFLVLADYLSRQGIAVLRYDKRGIGRSTGSYEKHTESQLAEDLYAVVQALKARHQFNRLGLVGHSEGPGIAAAVAGRYPQSVDFLVSLAGVGLPGFDMMLLQDRATATANGATPAEADQLVAYSRKYYQTIIAQADDEQRIAALKALDSKRLPADRAMADKYKMNQGSLSVDNGFAGKEFLRVMLMADTPRDWRAVKCPVLALNGSLDHQVPVENLAGIVANLQAGGNKNVESAVLPSLNHLFQTAKTGAEDEYDSIEETLAPLAMQRVAAFVEKQK
jgi:pimeloyl-ACP methyl ester carboxylesterase